MHEHLKKVEPDQSIQGIGQLDDTVRNDAGRPFFVSQEITPVLLQGVWNNATGRYSLTNPDTIYDSACTTSNASVATVTLTCPTGHRYIVSIVLAQNATQVSPHYLSGTIGGVTFTGPSTATSVLITTLLGGVSAGAASSHAISAEIVLDAGDVLNAVSSTCNVGVDVMVKTFIYKDVTL